MTFSEVLCRGSYGIVRRLIDKNSGNQYAAKFLRYSDPLVREELAQELEMMSLLYHNNIVQVIDGYEDKNRLVVVMEMYPWICQYLQLICEKLGWNRLIFYSVDDLMFKNLEDRYCSGFGKTEVR